MAKYTNKQSILDETLGDFKDYGFKLVEPDDHFTELYFKDKKLATYNQNKVTIYNIRASCGRYLKAISEQN